jgi:hypothetical protein
VAPSSLGRPSARRTSSLTATTSDTS